MTLLDAKPYDPAKVKRRKIKVGLIVVAVLVLVVVGWMYRNWPEEHVVSQFFAAIQKQDYEGAYGIYFHDPTWQRHVQKYSQYTYADFYRDWGPGGEWGLVKSHRIYGSASTPHGVILEGVVNGSPQRALMVVWETDKTLT